MLLIGVMVKLGLKYFHEEEGGNQSEVAGRKSRKEGQKSPLGKGVAGIDDVGVGGGGAVGAAAASVELTSADGAGDSSGNSNDRSKKKRHAMMRAMPPISFKPGVRKFARRDESKKPKTRTAERQQATLTARERGEGVETPPNANFV